MKPIYKVLRITVTDFLADARANGIPSATNNLYLAIGNEALAKQLVAIHQEAGLFFGRKAYREIERSAKTVRRKAMVFRRRMRTKATFGFNLQWIRDIINWFMTDLLQTVSNITNTTRDIILKVLAEAQATGASFEDIENQLQTVITPQRARLIARTETAKGAFVGRQLAKRDTKWETDKEWIAANDHRTRHGHRVVNGEMIDMDARFQVPRKNGVDMMEGPGDPTAHVGNIVQCRCALAFVAKRDTNGRLIPKQVLTTSNT